MNNLAKALLCGAAASVLAVGPAMAQNKHPAIHVMALHAGKAVNKTKMPNRGATHLTYTFYVYSYQPSTAPPKTHLFDTFYQFGTEGVCEMREHKLKVPKKSIYARIGTAIETYSFGCSNGPSKFYGDTWTNKTGKPGDVDAFVSTLIYTFRFDGTKYKASLNLDVQVFIE